MLKIAERTTSIAFERQLAEGFKNGENRIMVSNIRDSMDPNKKKVN